MAKWTIEAPDHALLKLKKLVDDYVETRLLEGREPKDGDHYIFEAAIELFYGPAIWKELNEAYLKKE